MAEYKDEIIDSLNSLIETCKDGEKGFRESAEAVNNPELKRLFQTYSEQRRQFASELQSEVRGLGADPDKSGSMSGSLHRGWINIKSAVTGKNEESIISEAERGEDVAVKAYEAAMRISMPADLQALISRQYTQVREAHDRVRALEKASSRS